MRFSPGICRNLAHNFFFLIILTDFCDDWKLRCTLIWKLRINCTCLHFFLTYQKQERICKIRVHLICKQCIIYWRFLKQLQTKSVIVRLQTIQLTFQRKPSVWIHGHWKLVIREWIIPFCMQISGIWKNLQKFFSRKGFNTFGCRITFQSFKKCTEMILSASCPVFKPQTVLDCKHDLSIRFQMLWNNF